MKRKRLLLFAITSLCATWGAVAVNQRIRSRAAVASQPALPSPTPRDNKPTFSFRTAMEAALALSVAEQRAAVVACFEHPELSANLEDADWVLGMYLADVNKGYPRVRKDDWLGYLAKLVRRNPQVAAEFLLRKDRLIGTGADDDARCLMSVWAGLNPLEAIAWAATGEVQGEWLRRNGSALAEAWAQADLQGLLDYVSAGGSEPSAWTILAELEKQRGLKALEHWLEAQQHADALLPKEMRQVLVWRVATHKLQEIGPAETAAWVGARRNRDELLSGLSLVAPAYARQQPARAMAWVEGFSATPGFPSRTGEVAMLEYATRDLTGAGEWLNAHLDSPIVSAYIWGYAVQAALEDPAAASAWVAKLPQTGGWGNPPSKAPGSPEAFGTGFEDMMEGGRTAKTLAMNIKAAARAGQIFRDPHTPLPPWEGERPQFLRYESPMLVKTSPDAEPMLQMKIHGGGCRMMFQGTWAWPFPTYTQGADGSLAYEQPRSSATN